LSCFSLFVHFADRELQLNFTGQLGLLSAHSTAKYCWMLPKLCCSFCLNACPRSWCP
jgi:hypothetical protein